MNGYHGEEFGMQASYPRKRRSIVDSFFSLLTSLVLLGTIFIGGLFATIYINPYIFFNPFPPPAEPAPPIAETPEITPEMDASPEIPATAEPSYTPALTPTPLPPTSTPLVITPEPTPLPFTIQLGTPAYIGNFLNDLGCDWLGVAGQVVGWEQNGTPDLWIHLGGEWEGAVIDLLSLPGSAPGYGGGGYEFSLGDGPIPSVDQIWIELQDPSGNPMTERVYLSTSENCDENLILVNWVGVE
jgi:hypothetical protein